MNYAIDVGFDDDTDVVTSRKYYRILDKYGALGIGHEKTQTSTMFISPEKPLNLEQLASDLGDIPILSVREMT